MSALQIDSQLLVLLLAGSTERSLIGQHRRLRAYSSDDFELLAEWARLANPLVVTPHTLTEASNLSRQIAEPYRSQLAQAFVRLASIAEERHISAHEAVGSDLFASLGLADVVVITACRDDTPLLTADLDLYLAAAARGIEAYNFSHLREAAGLT